MNLGWMDVYHIVDCAAMTLSERRTRNHKSSDPETRTILRSSAVNALRAVWSRGGPEEKRIVIARIQVWCRFTPLTTNEEHSARIASIESRLGLSLAKAA